MSILIIVLGILVLICSDNYMSHNQGYLRFFAYISFFNTPNVGISYCGGTRTQVSNRVHIVVASGSMIKLYLEGMHVTPPCTAPTIINDDAEDICLISNGRGAKLEGAWGNPRGNKGNLVLNKEEKKKEVQDDRPLRIKCTETT